MKRTIPMKMLSMLLVLVMTVSVFTISASAAEDNSGKYLKDVFIAYGEKKEDAEKWLRDNGWEPFADLNEGKSSKAKTNAVAVMGIKRTSDPNEAITDMATMFMKGGYSFDDYESLVAQKKTDIDEFINTFVPALQEYRDNYNGKGSEGGKKRAQMAHDILNKFYDGDPSGDYAVNDTGKPLGDLLLNETKTEIGDDAYNALSAEQKLNTADLQQIILESSDPAVQIVEQALALATDTSEDSWLDRLNGLSGQALLKRVAEFAPEAEGQDLAPSAAMSLLAAHFEDYAKMLAAQWIIIHENILWYESYCDQNDLWSEETEIISNKAEQYFNALREENEDRYQSEFKKFDLVNTYYKNLSYINYSGEWGETLYDFFRPEDENADYSEEYNYFAPLAAALSNGQRAALEFMTLPTLLKLGVDSDSVMLADFPSGSETFKSEDGKELESISIYSGINRAIGGALMILAAALKGVQLYQYYHRTFSVIPTMIVDESDIVTYTKDENGEQVKLINFDQFAYYEVVKCNRQEIGLHTSAQGGVSDYKSWGCGDAADINADVGLQWLAMYVNRSSAKGKPILADTLMLQKGKSDTPNGCNGCPHMFTFENPVKIDDTAYCYRDDNNGMYLFWKGDETAFAKSTSTGTNASDKSASTASAFNAGYLALAGIGGLVIGILGTTFVMFPMLKKKKEETAE